MVVDIQEDSESKKKAWDKSKSVSFGENKGTVSSSGYPSDDTDNSAMNGSKNKLEDSSPTTPDTKIMEEEENENMSSLMKFRKQCGDAVNHPIASGIVITLILVNSVMMGLGTFPFVNENPNVYFAFEVIDLVFLVFFTIEIVLQFIYHGLALFRDGWLVFDFAIVVFSWFFFEEPTRDVENAGGGGSVKIFRAFRIFRALRLVTRIESLRDLVSALLGVMPRMAAIAVLLLIIFYIFAVMFTDLFGDLYPGLTDVDYFSRLDKSLFTQFGMMTLDWAGVAREIMNIRECKAEYQTDDAVNCTCPPIDEDDDNICEYTYSYAWVPIIGFVMISSFIVFNLVIAVICDAVAVLHDEEELDKADEHDIDPVMLRKKVRLLKNQVLELTDSQTQMLDSIEFLTRQFEIAQSSKKKGSFE